MSQSLEHGLPALATGHYGKAAKLRGLKKSSLRQANHRHRAGLAQRQQTRIAKTAYQNHVWAGLGRHQGRCPGIQHGMRSHRVTCLTSDIGRAKAR